MANETSAINTPPAPNQETQVPSKPSTNPNPTQPTEVIPRELEGTAHASPKQSFLPYLNFGEPYLTRNEKTWLPPEPKFADHLDQHGSTVG